MRSLIVLMCILIIFSSCKSKAYRSIENLKKAINEESTASKMYILFAERAEADSMFRVAILFRAISASESIHANNYIAILRVLDKDFKPIIGTIVVNSTMENLKNAKSNEMYNIDNVYPLFIKIAKEEEFEEVIRSFEIVNLVENKHNLYYYRTISEIEFRNGKDNTLNSQWMVCPTCGNINEKDNVAALCDICKISAEKLISFSME